MLYSSGIHRTKYCWKIWPPVTSPGKKRESVENILKTMHFFIFFATFKQVRQTILTWNFKLKLICIILTFYVIYVPTEDFKRAKTWGKLPSQTSYLNIFFLLLLIKACRILKNMAQIIHKNVYLIKNNSEKRCKISPTICNQKSHLNISFLLFIDKSVRGFDKHGTNYT